MSAAFIEAELALFAAQAMEVGADLLSSDSHFGAIDGLAWLAFSPSEEDSVREQVWRYHTTPEP